MRPLLRFGTQQPPTRRLFSPQGRGVWMLIVMLGAVMLLMRQLRQPETEDFLGRVFSPERPAAGVDASKQLNAGNLAAVNRVPKDDPVADAASSRQGPWAAVKDKALFLPAEREAWSQLLERARRTSAKDLEQISAGEVAYAQLVNQPDVYRGRAVRIRGTVLREKVKRATADTPEIGEYHQLWLAPRGGGEWPIVVYTLEIPEHFPRGDGLREPVVVDGFFFKNWSYPHADGMGLAPVIVARNVGWQPPRTAPAPAGQTTDFNAVIFGAGLAAMAAMFFVTWIVRQTRRPPRVDEARPNLAGLETEP